MDSTESLGYSADLADALHGKSMPEGKEVMVQRQDIKGANGTHGHQGQLKIPGTTKLEDEVDRSGLIRVKLHSSSHQWDNKTEVEIKCENPDQVIDRMLNSIVEKFPPTSLVSVSQGLVAGNQLMANDATMSQNNVLSPHHTLANSISGYSPSITANASIPPGQAIPTQVHVPGGMALVPMPIPTQSNYVKSVNKPVIYTSQPKIEASQMVNRSPMQSYARSVPQEVEKTHYVVKTVPKYEYVDVPQEVIKYVPKIEKRIVEQIVQVEGDEAKHVPNPQLVEASLVVPKFRDTDVPVILSRTLVPEIEEVSTEVTVEVAKYVPYLVPVDVYVPRPVTVPIQPTKDMEQKEVYSTNVAPDVLQNLMVEMNPHLKQLQSYNIQQKDHFQNLISQSRDQAGAYGFTPPVPIASPYATENLDLYQFDMPEDMEDSRASMPKMYGVPPTHPSYMDSFQSFTSAPPGPHTVPVPGYATSFKHDVAPPPAATGYPSAMMSGAASPWNPQPYGQTPMRTSSNVSNKRLSESMTVNAS